LKKNNDDFDFIINISEDGWFGNSIGPHQHFTHSIFRAVEEGRNIIRSTNNGISALIGPKGNVISKIESTESGVLEIRNLKSNKETFFSKNGNNIFFYFLLFYITLIFFLKINREIK
jgi:apolipoprotein N-acyltransferase